MAPISLFYIGFLISPLFVSVVVAGVIILVIVVLASFIIIILACTRKVRRKDELIINSREAVYDELHERVPQDLDHQVVLKENAAYGQLTML